jgi:cysteine desulfurase/selenocysteine lyase
MDGGCVTPEVPGPGTSREVAELLDLDRVRRETPGCRAGTYLDSAGTSLMPRPVFDEVVNHLRRELTLGGALAARQASEEIERVYEALAALLRCRASELALVDSGTRAWQLALASLHLRRGDRVLTSRREFGSNLLALRQIVDLSGARLDFVKGDEEGRVSPVELANMLGADVKVIALSHVGHTGVVNPIVKVGRLARQAGIPFLVDGCQSAGQLDIDVETLGCDFFCGTGRKWIRGPRGTAFIYVRAGLAAELEPPISGLHAGEWLPGGSFEASRDARMFETWEGSYADRLGLGAAVSYLLDLGLASAFARISYLGEILRNSLSAADPLITVHEAPDVPNGITTFSIAGVDARAVRAILRERKIHVSLCRASHSRLDVSPHAAYDLVRASVHYFNTEAEIAALCSTLVDDVIRPTRL